MNPVGTEVNNLGFITEGVVTFVTNAPGSKLFPFQIQNRTLFRAIQNKCFITLQRSPATCTIFQSLLRLAASCNFPVLFSRYGLPCCCFLPNKTELCILYTMPLRNKISTHRIHRHTDIVRLIHNWATRLAALPSPSQLSPFRVERYGLIPLHSVPTNPISLSRAARPVFSKESHKTAPCNAGSCHSFLENCYD
ncbi:MAG: hypothetical protein DID89_2727546151 [Candidatus Nitrotoga sp. CP45]|nr:MAG: hypothetical protein DID89_2727546151 [Candidatus Nitrotoga sp. CP45]